MIAPWLCVECGKQLFDCECEFPAFSNHHSAFHPTTLGRPRKSDNLDNLDAFIPSAWRELKPSGRRLTEEEAGQIVWC